MVQLNAKIQTDVSLDFSGIQTFGIQTFIAITIPCAISKLQGYIKMD